MANIKEPNPPFRVTYILEEFPKLSESFIIEELKALHEKGVIAEVHSISRPEHLSDRHPDLITLTRYPRLGQTIRSNLFRIFSPKYWKWLFTTLRHYPTKLLAFFRAMSFLPLLRNSKPDHLHSHFATFASYMTMVLSDISAIPYSVTIHATGIFQEKRLIHEKCSNAAFVVAISDFNKKYLKDKFDVPEDKTEVVHCGILPSRFELIRKIREGREQTVMGNYKGQAEVRDGNESKEGMDKDGTEQEYAEPENNKPDPIRIFSIGRLVEKKGFNVLLEALHTLDRDEREKVSPEKKDELLDTGESEEDRKATDVERPCWDLIIAGDGPLRQILEESIREKGLERRVSLLGRVSGNQLLDELQMADLFVLPCVESSIGDIDGIPVVLMEALYCGIPTITTRISGIPELVIHEETGLLTTPGSASELVEAITRMKDHPEEAMKFAHNGMKKVEQDFNILKTTGQLYHQFEKNIR